MWVEHRKKAGVATMQTTLRYWEYYEQTETFSQLYEDSKHGKSFKDLYELIISEKNILLAYRRIKSNTGSKTPGIDGFTIDSYKNLPKDEFIKKVRKRLFNYKPKAVRRVFIPKPNGDLRPLGIPSMIDRLIQQMIKQILEPIAEAKFYNHSYGFRSLRSTHHAKSRCDSLINMGNYHFVVDIDIKGFFDNVNHKRLIQQLWNMGIKDKRVLAIIGKMLKAPIEGEGIPTKGTPQGGILSPLLSNIVLHDLDKWVYSQWEGFPSKFNYKRQGDKIFALKQTNLKEGYIVRYADDFKIFCKDSKTALKWFHAVKQYLKDRLGLDISPEKSKVVNLRKKSTEFLGFTIKAEVKGTKRVAFSHIRDKKKKEIHRRARNIIKQIRKSPTTKNIMIWNSFVLGVHNYFKYATHVYLDFAEISHKLHRLMKKRLGKIGKFDKPHKPGPTYEKFYGKNSVKTWTIRDVNLYPIKDISTSTNLNFSQNLTPYTEEGRELIFTKLKPNITAELIKLMNANIIGRSVEYMDNRISRYSMKNGLCEITKTFLIAEEVHCHHYKPIKLGGDDSFNNLRIIYRDVHKLVHATNKDTILKYLNKLKLNEEQLIKVNKYRKVCKLEPINITF